MSLSVSFQPLPTLNACHSVPIVWSYVGNTTQRPGEGLKLVFVSQEASGTSSVVNTSRIAVATTSSRIASTTPVSSTRLATTTSPSQTTRSATPTTSTTRTLARRAPGTTPFSKSLPNLPLTYTSYGWAPIALPSGTYDLSAFLVASGGQSSVAVGATRGVSVIQGTDAACLVASTTSATAISTTAGGPLSSAPVTTASATIGTSNGQPATTTKSSNAGLIGGIVGGVLGAVLLLGIIFLILRRRRRAPPSSGSWFRRDTSDRGIGSAHRYDFGSLGSTGTAPDSARRGMTEVSGPMNVAHVSGFPGSIGYTQGPGYGQEEKVMEKRPEGIPMVPVLPRSDTDMTSTSSGFMTPVESANNIYTRREQESPGGGIEFLASAPPNESAFPIYASSTDHSHDAHTSTQSHDRNPSESSITVDSHAGLITARPPFPTMSSETRRVSLYDAQLDRRPSTQARRKSGAPERSGSVRRKPVPVEAYDALEDPVVGVSKGEDVRAVPGKQFVLDVERPLSQGSGR